MRIDEAVVANTSPDKGTALSALRYWNEWNNERELHGGHDGLPEDDPAVEELLRTFWDNAESGWAKSKGFTTGGKGDPSSKAWSAAFISAAEDDPNFEDSQRHKDYMTDAEANRKKFDKGDDVRDLFVAFDPGEINPGPGDKRCHPRLGGKHCDICMDVGCTDIIGGNVGDDLTRRSASDAPAATMYITKGPAHIEIEKGDAITEITHKHLRDMIQEEMSFISDGKKASKTKGRPYKGSRRGKTESQAQQMAAGIALSARRKQLRKIIKEELRLVGADDMVDTDDLSREGVVGIIADRFKGENRVPLSMDNFNKIVREEGAEDMNITYEDVLAVISYRGRGGPSEVIQDEPESSWEDDLDFDEEMMSKETSSSHAGGGYAERVNRKLVNNARELKLSGVSKDHPVGIIRDEGGFLMPDIFGTVGSVIDQGSQPSDWAWYESSEHNMKTQLVPTEAAGHDGINKVEVPFYSLGRIFW